MNSIKYRLIYLCRLLSRPGKGKETAIISVETSDGGVNAWKCLERRRPDSGLLLIQALGANREKEQDMRLESSERKKVGGVQK